MELNEIREKIDGINEQMLKLFEERMELSKEAALSKQKLGEDVFVPSREVAIMEWVSSASNDSMRPYATEFFNAVLRISREYQRAVLGGDPQSGHNGKPVLTTKRLLLIPLDRGDVMPVFSLTSDPEVARYMKFEPHTKPEETEKLICEYTRGKSYGCKVLLRETGEFVGVFAIVPNLEDPQRASISAFFGKNHWGKGYAGELLEFTKKRARELTGVKSIWAYIVSDNERSARSARSAGFALDRVLHFPDLEGGLEVYRLDLE